MKTLLQYKASPGFRDLMARLYGGPDAVRIIDEADDANFEKEIVDTEILLHVLKPVTAAVIARAPRLKLIQKLGVGVNTIDLEAAARAGVAVCNIPGANSQAVAEMALSLMLAVLRQTVYFDALVRCGEGWRPDFGPLDRVGEIHGRTVGLIGFGQSARRLAPVLTALGAEVIYTAQSIHPDAVSSYRSLAMLLAQSDIISIHAPLTDQTRNLIDANALARMKSGAILINTARGELVDEAALINALRSGRLRGAGLDVFAQEPVCATHPLLSEPTVVLAPHVAWLTPETLERTMILALENCRRLADGRRLLNQVV